MGLGKTLHSIFAAAYPGYRFSHWVGTGILDSNSYSTSVDFDENTSVMAVFLEDNSDLPNLPPIIDQNGTFTLTVQSSNPEDGEFRVVVAMALDGLIFQHSPKLVMNLRDGRAT